MRDSSWIALVVAFLAAPVVALAGEAELNVVRSVQLAGDAKGASLTLVGSRAPTFTVFRLSDPARVVVDLAGADVSAVRGPRDGSGPIAAVSVSQFSDEHATVGRVVVALAEEARYEVKANGNDVVVAVAGERRADAAAAPVEPTVAAAPAPAAPPPSDEAVPREAAVPAPVGDVVSSRIDEREAKNPGHRVTGVRYAKTARGLDVRVETDGDVGTFELTELVRPPRLAIDLVGFDKASRPTRPPAGSLLKDVRIGRHEGKVRVVLEGDEAERMPAHDVARRSGGLSVSLGGKAPAAIAVAVPRAPAPAPEAKAERTEVKAERSAPAPAPVVAKVEKAPAPRARPSAVRDVAFKGDERQGRVTIAVGKGVDYQVSRPDPRTAVLTLKGAALPKRLERSLDTSAFGGPVKMVSSFAAPGEPDAVQVVATLDGGAEDRVAVEASGQIVWEFSAGGAPGKTAAAEMLIDGRRVDLEESAAVAPRAGAFSAEAGGYALTGAPRKSKYAGRRVSFEFKDIDIHNLLRIIAEVSKRNIVVADNVTGKVTIRLRNVPWDQALDLILRSKGLDKEEMGNIIRIAPLRELEEERKVRAASVKQAENVEPLKVRLIPVNYATASQIADKVKDLLSERGTYSVDTRTNVIIVKDSVAALARAEGLVRRLDTQTPQVLIEGRIVEANSTFARDFGIQWGGNVSLSPVTGNPTGLVFPNVVRVAGASPVGTAGTNGTADVPNFAVNMPAPVGAGVGGGLGFVFGSAGGAVALNLRLTAMENTGQIKTISAPKITTLDNTAATISQGVSIPFSQVSAAGVNTAFVEAKLELKVTPHVTADGSVLMDINASNNQPDPGNSGANGQPAISKKEAKTQVLVKDGDTTVIGGIYQRSQAISENSVPYFSKIPILGWFFRHKRESDSRTELLIFITPRIVNRSQVVAAGEAVSQ